MYFWVKYVHVFSWIIAYTYFLRSILFYGKNRYSLGVQHINSSHLYDLTGIVWIMSWLSKLNNQGFLWSNTILLLKIETNNAQHDRSITAINYFVGYRRIQNIQHTLFPFWPVLLHSASSIDIFDCIYQINGLSVYNPSRRLNVRCMK